MNANEERSSLSEQEGKKGGGSRKDDSSCILVGPPALAIGGRQLSPCLDWCRAREKADPLDCFGIGDWLLVFIVGTHWADKASSPILEKDIRPLCYVAVVINDCGRDTKKIVEQSEQLPEFCRLTPCFASR
jgi:hypothetical protein